MTKLSNFAKECLENIFYGKILALEELNQKGVYSKQAQMELLLSAIKHFIDTQPRSIFQIIVPDDGTDQTATLVVTNCANDDARNTYYLIINEDWTGYTVEQLALDGNTKVELDIVEIEM